MHEERIVITSWLVSPYDFYSWVVKNRKRTSEFAILHNYAQIENDG